jgi:hypothetical protein
MPTYPPIARTLCLLLLTVPLFGLGRRLPHPARLTLAQPVLPPPPSSPSAAARRIARRCWARAALAVINDREVLEAWDPDGTDNLNQEQWRRQLMAADRSGELKHALKWGRHAAALARTPEDTYMAARLLDRLECDAGHHDEELAHARKLMALQPRNIESLMLLQRAAVCNHRELLAELTAAEVRKLGYRWETGNESPCGK